MVRARGGGGGSIWGIPQIARPLDGTPITCARTSVGTGGVGIKATVRRDLAIWEMSHFAISLGGTPIIHATASVKVFLKNTDPTEVMKRVRGGRVTWEKSLVTILLDGTLITHVV